MDAYLLIKRFTTYWNDVRRIISTEHEKLTQVFHKSEKWPAEADLTGAAVGLTRLQETYLLNLTELTHGFIQGISYGSPLSAHDCFEVGRTHFR